MVPHVESAVAAKQIVDTVRYARPKDSGDKLIIAMVESMAAIDVIRELLAIDGIDVYFIGPSDLSSSMGYPGQPHHPEVKAMVKRVVGDIRAGGKQAGTLVVTATAAEFVEAGCRYLYEHANNFMTSGARDFRNRLNSKTTESCP